MKLDVFTHILPAAYFEVLKEVIPDKAMLKRWPGIPTLWDLDAHLRMMDAYDDYAQVLSLANPVIEALGPPDKTPGYARLANDGLAELCRKHPDRFPAFTASMPMNNPDAAAREAERAIDQLGARGIQVFTNVLGKPLTAPEFFPLFEICAKRDLPVWMHPIRGPNHPDYLAETKSEDEVWFTFGWPWETTVAMTRLVFSGLFDRLPDLKVITHHMGGMISFNRGKIGWSFEQNFGATSDPRIEKAGLKRPPEDYFRGFYADTALNGAAAPTVCGLDFFGPEHALFATDAPFDKEGGHFLIRETIKVVDELAISKADREKIYSGNTKRILKLG
ncbi:MAG: amidohydrolase family protein [Rhodospirillales bacterium]